MSIAAATTRQRHAQAGFTLVELLVALCLIGMILAAITGLMMSAQQTYLVETNQVEAQQVARLSLERMAREIRDAGRCPTCGGSSALGGAAMTPFPAFANITATSFTIQNDWNGNWNCPPGTALDACTGINTGVIVTLPDNTTHGEQVTYSVVGSVLQRQESGLDVAPQIIADNVAQAGATPFFQYLNSAGAATTDPNAVRTVVVSLRARPVVEPGSSAAGHAEVVVTSAIRLRNR